MAAFGPAFCRGLIVAFIENHVDNAHIINELVLRIAS